MLQLSLLFQPPSVLTLTQPLLSQSLSVSAKETHTKEGQGGWKHWKQARLETGKQPAAFQSTVQMAVCCVLSPQPSQWAIVRWELTLLGGGVMLYIFLKELEIPWNMTQGWPG